MPLGLQSGFIDPGFFDLAQDSALSEVERAEQVKRVAIVCEDSLSSNMLCGACIVDRSPDGIARCAVHGLR